MDGRDLLSANNSTSTASFPTAVIAAVGQRTVLEVMPFVKDGMDGGWFGRVSTTLILVFGTFGNVMTIVVLRRLRSGIRPSLLCWCVWQWVLVNLARLVNLAMQV